MKRTLSLKRESLAALPAEDLATVAGAAAAPTVPVEGCLRHSEIICYTRGTSCACGG